MRALTDFAFFFLFYLTDFGWIPDLSMAYTNVCIFIYTNIYIYIYIYIYKYIYIYIYITYHIPLKEQSCHSGESKK